MEIWLEHSSILTFPLKSSFRCISNHLHAIGWFSEQCHPDTHRTGKQSEITARLCGDQHKKLFFFPLTAYIVNVRGNAQYPKKETPEAENNCWGAEVCRVSVMIPAADKV